MRELIVKRLGILRQYEQSTLRSAMGATEKIAALERAFLAAAFRDELAPQDPTDKPASVLLERIRAEREASQPVKRKRAANTSEPARTRASKVSP